MSATLSVAGAVASIVGAGVAIWQAKRAWSAKRRAESAVRVIQNRDTLPIVQRVLVVLDELENVSVFFRGRTAGKAETKRQRDHARNRILRLFEQIRDLPGGGLDVPVSRAVFNEIVDGFESETTSRGLSERAVRLSRSVQQCEQWIVAKKEAALVALSDASTGE